MATDEREPTTRRTFRPAMARPLLRLLTWYECTGVVRGIVLRVPGGAGTALDATLLAALAMIRRGSGHHL
jgi:hypothetical protein